MNTIKYKGDCWPTHQQELLLKAALLRGNDAIGAWQKWKSSVDIERLDPGSHRLLPLLYYNLNVHRIDDPIMGKLKRTYRQTWYSNQLLIHRTVTLLPAFHRAGIKTMTLKGVPLTLLYYKNYGLRPMGDVDVLVPTEKATEAIDLLRDSGWKPAYNLPEKVVPFIHGSDFVTADGREHLDLHWHLLIECCQLNADEDFWDGATQITIENVSTYVLNPADQLLHVFAHGVKWSPIPPFRWIADASMIINSSQSEINWDRLMVQAEKRRLILPLKYALQYLQDTFDAPVPLKVLQDLQKKPISRGESLEYKYKSENHRSKLLGNLPILWFDSSRQIDDKPFPSKVVGFIRYLQRFWDVEHLWQLPFYALSMTLGKIRKMAN